MRYVEESFVVYLDKRKVVEKSKIFFLIFNEIIFTNYFLKIEIKRRK